MKAIIKSREITTIESEYFEMEIDPMKFIRLRRKHRIDEDGVLSIFSGELHDLADVIATAKEKYGS